MIPVYFAANAEDRMRIDSHQHFWRYNPGRDRWITEEMAVLRKDFLPEQLQPELAASNMQGSIAVQANQSEEETLFLLELAARNAFIRGVVGWVDLCAGNIERRLDFFSQHEKLCGFRHIVQAEADDRFMLRPAFLRGISCLEKFGFTYDILIYPKQLPAAIELVSKFPGQLFVIDHIAKPPIKERHSSGWGLEMRELAAHPNVYCKVSGMVTEADWKHWKPDDFKPYLDLVFEAFGVDRLMYGSDWPVCLLAAGYREVANVIVDYTKNLSQTDQEKIFGLNAARFYGHRASRYGLATAG